jgi:hypothetical protein
MSVVTAKIGRAMAERVGTAFAHFAFMATPGEEGLTRMPIARFGLDKVIGGTLLALACGCISPALAQPATPDAAASFSGTYTGTTQHISGHDGHCWLGGPVKLEVHDGRFRFPWNEPQEFDVKIGPDGTFNASSPGVLSKSDKHMMLVPTMQGYVSGSTLVADYGTVWCHYRLEATR